MTAPWPAGPERAGAVAGEVHLWLASLEDGDYPPPDGLPAPERERAESFLRPEVAARWVASRWALRQVLAAYLAQPPAEIEIAVGEHGKPRLAGGDVEFNLSHSGDVALVAVTAGREVGVDVECVDPERDFPALAERGLDAEVAAAVRAAPADEQSLLFHRSWARHEAELKCLGVGLAGKRAPQERLAVAEVEVGPGYVVAVAVRGRETGTLRCWSLPASAT
ncbi:MAG TPA: 4'-phosphopantetheinyl transferase superfamily protein [Solirubrobacterales bacterium]|nr:4'-phosphopantetheinyl transferase superfamily protein [Solirubrobacterales bacterium]